MWVLVRDELYDIAPLLVDVSQCHFGGSHQKYTRFALRNVPDESQLVRSLCAPHRGNPNYVGQAACNWTNRPHAQTVATTLAFARHMYKEGFCTNNATECRTELRIDASLMGGLHQNHMLQTLKWKESLGLGNEAVWQIKNYARGFAFRLVWCAFICFRGPFAHMSSSVQLAWQFHVFLHICFCKSCESCCPWCSQSRMLVQVFCYCCVSLSELAMVWYIPGVVVKHGVRINPEDICFDHGVGSNWRPVQAGTNLHFETKCLNELLQR